jgi:transcriptional regulator with XRE-family HTH domain
MSIPDPSTDRPALRAFRKRRRLTRAEVAEAIGVSAVQVGRYELPFSDPSRQVPRVEVLEKIIAFTEGAVGPLDFYPPHLREPRSSDAVAQ